MVAILQTCVQCFTVFCVAFLILLAMPASRLRNLVLELFSYAGVGASAVYVVFPIDILPDFIPIAGWIDDVVAIIAGVKFFFRARSLQKERQRLFEESLKRERDTARLQALSPPKKRRRRIQGIARQRPQPNDAFNDPVDIKSICYDA